MTQRVFTQTFATVGALIERDGKFLLVKEASRKKVVDYGKWNIPEGWLDVGEHPFEAVKREVEEETGYAFQPTAVLGIYSVVRRDVGDVLGSTPHAITMIFVGDCTYGDPVGLHDDVSETKWFLPEEINKMGQELLRNVSIKKMLDDYSSKNRYPLELIQHSIQRTI